MCPSYSATHLPMTMITWTKKPSMSSCILWTSRNGWDQSQIDHLMVKSMWRRSLLDVKVRRGADVGSDHHLVTARVRLKLRAAGPKKQINPRYDISGLQDPRINSAFVLQLRNSFQTLSLMDEPDAE